jgi:hypothetical protein
LAIPDKLGSFAFGGPEELGFVYNAYNRLVEFFQDEPADTIVDMVGYSRGAFGVAYLAHMLDVNGIPKLGGEVHFDPGGTPIGPPPLHPAIGFVGLISPVNQMGEGGWYSTLPSSVGFLSEALDNLPGDPIIPETTINRISGSAVNVDIKRYNGSGGRASLSHIDIGYDGVVRSQLYADAELAGVSIIH